MDGADDYIRVALEDRWGCFHSMDEVMKIVPQFRKRIRSVYLPSYCPGIPDDCFAGCKHLAYITLANNSCLKRIGCSAFSRCKRLRMIEITASVEEIGENCFSDCPSLARAVFRKGSVLKSIGSAAFANCSSLDDLEIPEGVEFFGDECFAGCSSLTRVIFMGLPKLTRLGMWTFSHCSKLESIEIPAGVEEIPEGCFLRSGLRVITFAKGSCLKRIGCQAFSYTTSLTDIEIPSPVEEIGERCFMNSSVFNVTFADNNYLRRIDDYAFAGCKMIHDLQLPASIEEIGVSVFVDCNISNLSFSSENSFYSVLDPFIMKKDGMVLTNAFRNVKEVVIPACAEEIDDNLFNYESTRQMSWMDPYMDKKLKFFGPCLLTRVMCEEGSHLRRIGNFAFGSCARLTHVKIPASVEEIGIYCFFYSSVASITFEEGSRLRCIEDSAFTGCKNLKTLAIPESVEKIKPSAFSSCDVDLTGSHHFMVSGPFLIKKKSMKLVCICKPVEEVEIPAYIKKISGMCFSISSLKRVSFEHDTSIKVFSSSIFAGCNLEEIVIPPSVENIDDCCFMRSNTLRRVTFAYGSRLKRIGNMAFHLCGMLKEIEIPASVEEIGDSCFSGGIDMIEANSYNGLTESLNDSTDELYQWFRISGCSLTRVTFARGSCLKRIGAMAFCFCHINEIEIPASVEEIGQQCFDGCSSLTRVIFANKTSLPRIGRDAFPRTVSIPELGQTAVQIRKPTAREEKYNFVFEDYEGWE